MRFATAVRLVFLILFVAACASSGPTSDRQMNDAKAALVLSTDLYDTYMRAMGARYQAGACSETCKERTIGVANVYLTAARAMKLKLDAGQVDFLNDYQTIFDTISQLYALVHNGAGANVQPPSLPSVQSLNMTVAPQGALTWPLGTSHGAADVMFSRDARIVREIAAELPTFEITSVSHYEPGQYCIDNLTGTITCYRTLQTAEPVVRRIH